jgi:hypothetical protein
MGEMVWLAWRWGEHFEILGLYSNEDAAKARCELPIDGIGPLVVDQDMPDESIAWPGAYYPVSAVRATTSR